MTLRELHLEMLAGSVAGLHAKPSALLTFWVFDNHTDTGFVLLAGTDCSCPDPVSLLSRGHHLHAPLWDGQQVLDIALHLCHGSAHCYH